MMVAVALTLCVCLLIFLLSISSTFGLHGTLFVIVLFSLCLYPLLLTARRTTQHVGIAPPTPEIRTYTVVLVAISAIALLCGRRSVKLPASLLLLPIWVTFGMIFVWKGTVEHWSGVLQLSVGLCGWFVGSFVATGLAQCAGFDRLVAQVVFGIIAIQGIVACMQIAGIPINALSLSESSILNGRPNGTFNHPDNLGKAVVMLLLLALPLSRSKDRTARYLGSATIFLSLVPLGLAQGRANFIGAIIAVAVWTWLLPRSESISLKVGVLFGTGVVGSAFLGVILSRFAADPTGGARDQLTTYALQQIPRSPISGVGPNGYTTATAPFTGSYIPVHNTVLLAAAELGIPGAMCLLAPFVVVVARSWKVRLEDTSVGDHGRALVALSPALILIGLTGWGLLGSVIWPLWCFVTAFTVTKVLRPPSHPVLSPPGVTRSGRTGSQSVPLAAASR